MLFVNISTVYAQELKERLPDLSSKEPVPPSPGPNYTWVKGHYEPSGSHYVWVKGEYVPTKPEHHWVDGEWERKQNNGWWVYNQGYWQKGKKEVSLKTASGDTESINPRNRRTGIMISNKKPIR